MSHTADIKSDLTQSLKYLHLPTIGQCYEEAPLALSVAFYSSLRVVALYVDVLRSLHDNGMKRVWAAHCNVFATNGASAVRRRAKKPLYAETLVSQSTIEALD